MSVLTLQINLLPVLSLLSILCVLATAFHNPPSIIIVTAPRIRNNPSLFPSPVHKPFRILHGDRRSPPSVVLKSSSSPKTSTLDLKIEFELHTSISSIPSEEWDSFLAPDGSSSPFLEHAWLRSLEESGCASPENGWGAQHISFKIDGRLAGYVPLYIKGHSMGEFIFDNAWAEAAEENGINYYPKLLVGIPFTPATCAKVLLDPTILQTYTPHQLKNLRVKVGHFLKQIALSNDISSVHINFLTDGEAADITGIQYREEEIQSKEDLRSRVTFFLDRMNVKTDENDYLRRTSVQYHWTNANSKNGFKKYESFEDYLGCFKSKRRITIRRERRRVIQEGNIRLDAIVGREILQYPGLVERMYEIYESTIDKMYWGRKYLSLEFFQLLAQSEFVEHLCFICARDKSQMTAAEEEDFRASDVIAGTFNVLKDGVFYGRYWGCLPGRELKNLHFEVCYWAAIEFCISNGLQKMEPGAGGGDYKWARGFDAALIHSAHYISHPGLRRAVNRFLTEETKNNVEVTDYLMTKSVVGKRQESEDF